MVSSARWLNLELRDSTGAPLADREYVLILPDGSRREGRLDGAGYLHEPVPADATQLLLDVAERRITLDVAGMPAHDSVEGAQERLNHLNYFVGDVDGKLGPFTRMAIERFQRDHDLPVTGVLDRETFERLRGEHGA
jgi:hypothetical protein